MKFVVGQGGEVPYAEMLGTFALSVGAAVSCAIVFNYFFASFSIFIIDWKLNKMFRWEWSSGPDGRIKHCGTLPCGTCTRLLSLTPTNTSKYILNFYSNQINYTCLHSLKILINLLCHACGCFLYHKFLSN